MSTQFISFCLLYTSKEFDEDTEKKGLGTPATRAGIIEKLIYSQYATRKGKQIIPTDDGKVLVEILPDFLKSASMTAEWENQLLLMEHGEIAPEPVSYTHLIH